MYRCSACDAPAQAQCGHDAAAADFNKAMEVLQPDPWGWKEEPKKLDIQSGTYVETVREGVCT